MGGITYSILRQTSVPIKKKKQNIPEKLCPPENFSMLYFLRVSEANEVPIRNFDLIYESSR